MAITLVGSASATGTSSTAAVTHGLTILENDFVLVNVGGNGTNNIPTSYAAFTAITGHPYAPAASFTGTVIYKQATASEPVTYSFPMTSSDRWVVTVIVFRGAAPLSWDVEPITDQPVIDTIVRLPSITTLTTNTMVVALGTTDNASNVYSAPTNGYGDLVQGTGGQSAFVISQSKAATGAVGTAQLTQTANSGMIVSVGALKEVAPTSETATTGNIPLTIQADYTLVDLVDPVTTNASLLFGVTGDTPVTGDHLEYDVTSVLDSGVTLSVAADGVWTVTEATEGDWVTDITVSRRVVQADGTIGTEAVVTLSAPTSATSGLTIVTDMVSNIVSNMVN